MDFDQSGGKGTMEINIDVVSAWFKRFSEADRQRIVGNVQAKTVLTMAECGHFKDTDEMNRRLISAMLEWNERLSEIALDREQRTFPVYVKDEGMIFYRPEGMSEEMESAFGRWVERKKAMSERGGE